MDSITVISASNRHDNKTRIFAEVCVQYLEKEGVEVMLYSLEDLPDSVTHQSIYTHPNNPIQPIVDKFVKTADKLVFVLPEYNGSYPGILKVFIDAIHPSMFAGKKAALIGVASGRSGNLRGMDHLTNILNYLKVEVLSNKLPISGINQLLDEHDKLIDDATKGLIQNQMKGLINY